MRLIALLFLLGACNGARKPSSTPVDDERTCQAASDCVLWDPPDCCNDWCDGSVDVRAVNKATQERAEEERRRRCEGKMLDCPKPECDRSQFPTADCRAGLCVVVPR